MWCFSCARWGIHRKACPETNVCADCRREFQECAAELAAREKPTTAHTRETVRP